ncbi:hypothetical protein ACFE04_013752 [Oxalis oulophora]
MASTSKLDSSSIDGRLLDEEEEFERFDDFTLASSWERFISELEAVCRQWLADGSKNLLEKGAVQVDFIKDMYTVKSEFKYALKSYSMEFFFQTSNDDGKDADWNCTLHDLQLCFGVKEFLVIAPQSASGVVLDAPEASKLLSAVAIALSNCGSLWPAFVPVHDPSRKAYIGIQNMGTIFTRRFEADRIGSQVPVKFLHLEGLYELFVSKSAFSLDLSMQLFKVHFFMKLTYRTLPFEDDIDVQGTDTENIGSRGNSGNDTHSKTQWDDDCPWSEWYSADDPVKGFELITIWPEKIVESSLEMAELENDSPDEADKWILLPNLSPIIGGDLNGVGVGFSSQLQLLVNALEMSFEAQFLEDFVSVENPTSDNLKSTMVVPPSTVVDRVLKDIFHDVLAGMKPPDFAKGEHKSSRAIKGAPCQSLFAQFCLHALWFGNCNVRAIAVLWIEFVREVNWCWEETQPLPKMPANGSVDLSTCLINQKLQMLAICIEMKREMNEEFEDCIGSNDNENSKMEEDGQVVDGPINLRTSHVDFHGQCDSPLIPDGSTVPGTSGTKPEEVRQLARNLSDMKRRGSSGVVGSVMLLHSHEPMHAPYTHDGPLMTEDMHEERLQAVEAIGSSFNFSGQLEKDILSSDMSAFKAANPAAVFEDFIRWHSPGDWENEEVEASSSSKDNWPPQGRLSQRMSEHGNLWRKIWDEAPSIPASDQKPLLDPKREAEKIIHYLETLRPHQLLEQMVCTAFKASADTLRQTNFGDLPQMRTKIDQLYLTMPSMLRALQTNHFFGDSDTFEDLRRLCTVFQHVEKLVTLAASLHRKFSLAPRLSAVIFNDFYNFYAPRMGTGTTEDLQSGFDSKQAVRKHERRAISNMFVQPTANQSWRKVLSMGNLLNGHEPVLREIIFSVRDRVSSNHYASRTEVRSQDEEIETYRMYTCGTSNDLRVALCITSCD